MRRALSAIWACLAAAMFVGCAEEFCSDRELETRAGRVCFEDATNYFDYYIEDAEPGPLIADLDQDDDLDITTVARYPALLAVLINDGERQLSVHELVPTSEIVRSSLVALALGDFDLDGDPDIVAASEEAIWIVENSGDGQFSLRHTIEHAQSDLAIHDVVGDAQPELVLVGSTLDLASDLLSTTPSVTTVAQLVEYTGGPPYVHDVATADVSGDGLVDIVVTPGPIIFWGTPEGLADVPFVSAEFVRFCDDPITLDVDRDGTLDIACGSNVLLGRPQASWVDAQPIRLDPPGEVSSAGIMPLPHGDPSLVFVGTDEGESYGPFCTELAVVLVDSSGAQALDDPRSGFVSFKSSGLNIRNSVYADIDGDGHVDISDGPNIRYGRSCR